MPAGGVNESNMAVMEVNFPSGFTADLDTLPSLEVSEHVKKVETKNADTTVIVYFDSLGFKEVCPTLDAFRTHKVAKQRPSDVIIYDYYDNCKKPKYIYPPIFHSVLTTFWIYFQPDEPANSIMHRKQRYVIFVKAANVTIRVPFKHRNNEHQNQHLTTTIIVP